LPISHLAPLAIGLLLAVVYDLKQRRIPNKVSAFVLVTGLAMRGWEGGPSGALFGLLAAVLIMALLYAPWRAGGLGGGDVKLAAAAGAWVDLRHLHWFLLATALAGGLVAAAYYLRSSAAARAETRANLVLAAARQELPPVPSNRKGHPSVPYALAISAGASIALLVI
jgi:prepilin peptidase CpaA